MKHLQELRNAIGKNGQTSFKGYGDLSLAEFLPALLTRYSETRMLLAAPTLPLQSVTVLSKWMKRQWARMDGKGKLDVIQHLDIITDLSKKGSPALQDWVSDNPFGERLSLHNVQHEEYVILLPDIAILGFSNMQYADPFVATVTTKPEVVDELWKKYELLAATPQETARRRGGRKKAQDAVEEPLEEAPAAAEEPDTELSAESQEEEATAAAVEPVIEQSVETVESQEAVDTVESPVSDTTDAAAPEEKPQ